MEIHFFLYGLWLQVLLVSFVLSIIKYGLMVILGYLMFGKNLTSQITLNLPAIQNLAYRLALLPSMIGVHEVFHVSMLQKYTPDPAHVVNWGQIEVDTDGTFEEGPNCILDSRDQVLRRKTVRLVRVLWRHYGVEESTWEREDTMRATYPFLFRDEGTWFSRLAIK